MNGPEHYLMAEQLLAHSRNHTDQGNSADDKIAELAATQAQVHATLALAAATAHVGVGIPEDGDTAAAWRRALINRPTKTAEVNR